MKVEIRRVVYHKYGTFGVLLIDDLPFCVTLEEPNLGNQSHISCVPTGAYEVEYWNTAHFPNTYHVKDVPGRDAILIHSGNTIEDTEGCILLGTFFASSGKLPSVAGSRDALNKFRSVMKRDKFTLTIKD